MPEIAMRLKVVAILLIAIGVVAVGGAFLASGWTPTIPADAASVVLARATLTGDLLPDPGSDTYSDATALTPNGQKCLDRITHPSGWLDLCWEAFRQADGDVGKDYYILRVYGTLSGSGTGVRWTTLRANLAPAYGQPADGVFGGWPSGLIEGPCAEFHPPSYSGSVATETICGRTNGEPSGSWGHRVTWVCQGCLIADHSDRSVFLEESVGVLEGTVPAWDIGADFGD